MLKTIALIGSLLAGTSAMAGSFDPAVMDPVVVGPASSSTTIYQCDPVFSTLRPNEVLYHTGPAGCVPVVPDGTTGTVTGTPDEEDKVPDTDKPGKDKPSKDKGNASANNGKGGNYDKTGHSDNGKGNGKGRR